MHKVKFYQFSKKKNSLSTPGKNTTNFETDVVTGATDLVAKFTESARTYTVTFDGENAQECGFGGKLTEPSVPEKEGYRFIGWFNGNKQWNFETDVVIMDTQLVSKWELIEAEKPAPEEPAPEEPAPEEPAPEEPGAQEPTTSDTPETPDRSTQQGNNSDASQFDGALALLGRCQCLR